MASWTQNSPFYPMTLQLDDPDRRGHADQPRLVAPAAVAEREDRHDDDQLLVPRRGRSTVLASGCSYRSYGYKDKSARYVITGDTSGAARSALAGRAASTAEEPYGHATANRTDADTSMFNAQVSYDIKALTLEGAYRNASSTWVGRVASSGDEGEEKTYTVAAIYHASDLLGIRFHNDWANRTVSGVPARPSAPFRA